MGLGDLLVTEKYGPLSSILLVHFTSIMREGPLPSQGASIVPAPAESFGQSERGAAVAVGVALALAVGVGTTALLVADALAEAPPEAPESEQPAMRQRSAVLKSVARPDRMAGEATWDRALAARLP
jgi:hypothetical protein